MTANALTNILTTMPHTESDTLLLQRISVHDEAALCELYTAYGRRLFSYAVHLTGDTASAEDVVQETLVTVWKKPGTYRGEGRVVAWLLGIVHNLALKTLRRRSIPITDELEAILSASDATPEIQAQENDQARTVQIGLQCLSPEHRAVLELVFYQGLSLEETAQVCKCPLGTVKSRLSYARQHLRGVLSRQKVEV